MLSLQSLADDYQLQTSVTLRTSCISSMNCLILHNDLKLNDVKSEPLIHSIIFTQSSSLFSFSWKQCSQFSTASRKTEISAL